MYRRLAIVALLVISVLLVLILVRSAQQRSCLVEVKGISPSNILSTNQKHTVEVYGSCKDLRIAKFGISAPLSGRPLSEQLPTKIPISTGQEEGIGYLTVGVARHSGQLVYSTKIPVAVQRYPLFEPKAEYAKLYRLADETVLRVALSLDRTEWKDTEPNTVYLWLLDNQWQLLNEGKIPLRQVIENSGNRGFCAQFAANKWIFDFTLPSLRGTPAYALVVGGGRRAKPGEFNFQTLIPYSRIANPPPDEYASIAVYPAPNTQKSGDACRWRWWYAEHTTLEESPPTNSSIAPSDGTFLPRHAYFVADKTNPFLWSSQRVGLLIIWHEASGDCKPSMEGFVGGHCTLSEEWNKGGILFSGTELEQITGIKSGGRSKKLSLAYQFFYRATISAYPESLNHEGFSVQLAGCSHQSLQDTSAVIKPSAIRRLPATLPIHTALGGRPLINFRLVNSSSDPIMVNPTSDWLSIRMVVDRLYFFAIPSDSKLSRTVFDEDSSIRCTLLTRCANHPEMPMSFSIDGL